MKNFLWVLYKPTTEKDFRIRDKAHMWFLISVCILLPVALVIDLTYSNLSNEVLMWAISFTLLAAVGVLSYVIAWFRIRDEVFSDHALQASKRHVARRVLFVVMIYLLVSLFSAALMGGVVIFLLFTFQGFL